MTSQDNSILFERKGCAGLVTLNRPEHLNAVTGSMLSDLSSCLDSWESDTSIDRVIIRSTGRAFSSGGDIRHLYESGLRGEHNYDFFAREYRLNARIASYSKPYVAVVDGIAMGGGVGVSFHGSHIVAGDNFLFAMPEVGIGFFPDVGGSYLLSRLPGHLGLYLGLTGTRMGRDDGVTCGLATCACPSSGLDDLIDSLCSGVDISSTLESHSIDVSSGPVMTCSAWIDEAFGYDSVIEIIRALESMIASGGERGDWASLTYERLTQQSPTSLEVTFFEIRHATSEGLSMAECMKMEYRILRRILSAGDFYEGIRATIIDKDGSPHWSPPSLDLVDPAVIRAHFEHLDTEELVL